MSNETHKYQRTVHQGRNVQRFRELFKISQDQLAELLGDDWSQKSVSRLEAQEEIEPELIEKLAKILNVPGAALKNFTEDAMISLINTTFGDLSSDSMSVSVGTAQVVSNTITNDGVLIKEMIGLLQKLLEQRK